MANDIALKQQSPVSTLQRNAALSSSPALGSLQEQGQPILAASVLSDTKQTSTSQDVTCGKQAEASWGSPPGAGSHRNLSPERSLRLSLSRLEEATDRGTTQCESAADAACEPSRVKPKAGRMRGVRCSSGTPYVNFDDAGVMQQSDDPGDPRPRLRRYWHDGPGNNDRPYPSEGSKGMQKEDDGDGTLTPIHKRRKTSSSTQSNSFKGGTRQQARSDRYISQMQMPTLGQTGSMRHDVTNQPVFQGLSAKKGMVPGPAENLEELQVDRQLQSNDSTSRRPRKKPLITRSVSYTREEDALLQSLRQQEQPWKTTHSQFTAAFPLRQRRLEALKVRHSKLTKGVVPENMANKQEFWNVECIQSARWRWDLQTDCLIQEYLVRWENYGPDSDTWEPKETLKEDVPDMVRHFDVMLSHSGKRLIWTCVLSC